MTVITRQILKQQLRGNKVIWEEDGSCDGKCIVLFKFSVEIFYARVVSVVKLTSPKSCCSCYICD